jgi:hypothetical protein
MGQESYRDVDQHARTEYIRRNLLSSVDFSITPPRPRCSEAEANQRYIIAHGSHAERIDAEKILLNLIYLLD